MKEKSITLNTQELAYAYSLIHSQVLEALVRLSKEFENLSDFKNDLVSTYLENQVFTRTDPFHIGEEKTTEIRKALADALHQLIETLEASKDCKKGVKAS